MKNVKVFAIAVGAVAFLGAKGLSEIKFSKNHEPIRTELEDISSVRTTDDVIPADASKENKIQVALLLDTSNSMDGLIDQAKSRLWNIVNTLTTLKYDGKAPQIEIALYEYGNDGIRDENFIRQVTPLTQDLDLISEKLFALRTNGGQEYCGAVIKSAANGLSWNDNPNSMKLIYIAGNEPFNQGKVDYKEVIGEAKSKKIFVNTIFCGDRREGIDTFWQNGADLGSGKYFNIDSNREVIIIETPYDRRISDYNEKLNGTYIYYGSKGESYKNNQMMQDNNASMKSASIAVERAVSKSKKNAYNNEHWDLVDKAEKDKDYASKLKNDELPKELKGKSKTEIEKIVNEKSTERSKIQKEISELSIQRQKYIDEEMKKKGNNNADDLGAAIEKSIMELTTKNGYSN